MGDTGVSVWDEKEAVASDGEGMFISSDSLIERVRRFGDDGVGVFEFRSMSIFGKGFARFNFRKNGLAKIVE